MALLPSDVRRAWIAKQPDYILQEILRGEWWWVSRPEQVPPIGDWFICLALAGRGFGKSRAGSEWIVDRILKHPYERHGVPTEWLVIAETLSDARAICMEGPAGILQVLQRRKVEHDYKKSPRPHIEFPNGSKLHTEGADNPDVGRGYNLAGAWLDEICIAKDEPVWTEYGPVPVQNMQVGMRVWTRRGLRRVGAARLTRRDAAVLCINTTSGTVFVTPEHRVWANNQWTMAADLLPGDIMATCPPNMKHLYQVQHQRSTPGTEQSGTTTSARATTTAATDPCCTAHSGRTSMAPSRMATKSTTGTITVGTTGSITWNSSPSMIIASSLPLSATMRPGKQTRHQKLSQTGSLPTGNGGRRAPSYAQSVGKSSLAQACEPSSVAQSAGRQMGDGAIESSVLSIAQVASPIDVYDITVEGDAPEFFAGVGALLVHNCKWKSPKAAWTEGIMPSLRADLVGDHPRTFVTTTPKPIDLIQEWVRRDDGSIHVIRGSTFDNATNLSSMVIEELKRRYEGTAIGRQELYGELVDAFDGALFSRLDIENFRWDDPPDDPVATVVGVDPSLTGEDDEMGIVVASRTRDKHMYVLGDHSIMAVGRAAALEAWRIVARYGADKLVVEENLGKRWMQQVFQDAYYELVKLGEFPENTQPPLVRVDAKLGKRTRGEPVAMRCEQGRLHMVGRWPQLEDQMATFTAWGARESPDRLDALVHACRWLMEGEKKESRVTSPRDILNTTLQSLLADAESYHFG